MCRTAAKAPYRLHLAGRESCPTGFSKLYSGFLISQHYTHRKAEYSCLDVNAIGVGSAGNENLGLIYVTEGFYFILLFISV